MDKAAEAFSVPAASIYILVKIKYRAKQIRVLIQITPGLANIQHIITDKTERVVSVSCVSKGSSASVQVSSDISYQLGPVSQCSLCPTTLPIKEPFSLRTPEPV